MVLVLSAARALTRMPTQVGALHRKGSHLKS
jgi:hypothetical protein